MINADDDRVTVMLLIDPRKEFAYGYYAMWCQVARAYIAVSTGAVDTEKYIGGVIGKVQESVIREWSNLAQLGYDPVKYYDALPLDDAQRATPSPQSLRLFTEDKNG